MESRKKKKRETSKITQATSTSDEKGIRMEIEKDSPAFQRRNPPKKRNG